MLLLFNHFLSSIIYFHNKIGDIPINKLRFAMLDTGEQISYNKAEKE